MGAIKDKRRNSKHTRYIIHSIHVLGYHSASLIDNKMWVFGGSDGQECFSDVSILDPGT